MSESVIKVACAIIEQGGKILVAQRSERMSLPLKWEFPGGKLDVGEKAADCLIREIREELGLDVKPIVPLPVSSYPYVFAVIELIPFICRISGGELALHEHRAVVWLSPEELAGLDWAEADIPVLHEYLSCHRL